MNDHADTEARARELLAVEYERTGNTSMARALRDTPLKDLGDRDFARSIRAIIAALEAGRSGEAGELEAVAEIRETDGRVQTVWLGYHITDFVGQRLYAVPPTKDANNG